MEIQSSLSTVKTSNGKLLNIEFDTKIMRVKYNGFSISVIFRSLDYRIKAGELVISSYCEDPFINWGSHIRLNVLPAELKDELIGRLLSDDIEGSAPLLMNAFLYAEISFLEKVNDEYVQSIRTFFISLINELGFIFKPII